MKAKSKISHLIPTAKETNHDTMTSCEQLHQETIMAIGSHIADAKFQGLYQCNFLCDPMLSPRDVNSIATYLRNLDYHVQTTSSDTNKITHLIINWDLSPQHLK